MSIKQAQRSSISMEERPPVTDAVMAHLYRADLSEVGEIANTLPGDVRAKLAAFCYSRAHLRAIGRVVAARCDDLSLLRSVGGAVGACLIDAKKASERELHDLSGMRGRPKVTLATAADMRRRFPIEAVEDID